MLCNHFDIDSKHCTTFQLQQLNYSLNKHSAWSWDFTTFYTHINFTYQIHIPATKHSLVNNIQVTKIPWRYNEHQRRKTSTETRTNMALHIKARVFVPFAGFTICSFLKPIKLQEKWMNLADSLRRKLIETPKSQKHTHSKIKLMSVAQRVEARENWSSSSFSLRRGI